MGEKNTETTIDFLLSKPLRVGHWSAPMFMDNMFHEKFQYLYFTLIHNSRVMKS